MCQILLISDPESLLLLFTCWKNLPLIKAEKMWYSLPACLEAKVWDVIQSYSKEWMGNLLRDSWEKFSSLTTKKWFREHLSFSFLPMNVNSSMRSDVGSSSNHPITMRKVKENHREGEAHPWNPWAAEPNWELIFQTFWYARYNNNNLLPKSHFRGYSVICRLNDSTYHAYISIVFFSSIIL